MNNEVGIKKNRQTTMKILSIMFSFEIKKNILNIPTEIQQTTIVVKTKTKAPKK
jgi:hypothetical protein